MADEIIPGLFIGDVLDSQTFKGPRMCVLEDLDFCKIGTKEMKWNPILEIRDRSVWANPKRLNEAANWIDKMLKKNKSVLVNCAASVERSPLTVAWYLHKKKGMSMDKAYEFIQERHPVAERRDYWLTPPPHTGRDSWLWSVSGNWVGGWGEPERKVYDFSEKRIR